MECLPCWNAWWRLQGDMHMPTQPFLQIPLDVTLPRIPQQALRCKNHSRGNCLLWEDHELVESGQSSFLLPGPGNRLCSLHPVVKGPRLLFIWYAAVQKSKVSPFSTYLVLKKSHQQGGGPSSTSPALPQQQAASLGTDVAFCTVKDLSSVFSAVHSCSPQGRPLDFWAALRISSGCPACG